MKAGAIDFLPKPFTPAQLLATVEAALALDRERLAAETEVKDLRDRYDVLTPREREVLPLVVLGLVNKQAAFSLGISEVTYQIHRGSIMRKMEAPSLADLVRMSIKLGIPTGNSEVALKGPTLKAQPGNSSAHLRWAICLGHRSASWTMTTKSWNRSRTCSNRQVTRCGFSLPRRRFLRPMHS